MRKESQSGQADSCNSAYARSATNDPYNCWHPSLTQIAVVAVFSDLTTISTINLSFRCKFRQKLTPNSFPIGCLSSFGAPFRKPPYRRASEALLERLSIRHSEKPLITRGGRTISSIPTQGLLSGDGCWLYPVHGQIPTLIPDEAIAVSSSENR